MEMNKNGKIFAMVAAVALVGGLAMFWAFGAGRADGQSAPAERTVDGVRIVDVAAGSGAEALPGKAVAVWYTGTLPDGKTFDSNVGSGRPLAWQLGGGQMIKGFDIGVTGMKVGGKRKIVLPPELAYGSEERRNEAGEVVIPANSSLVFELELIAVQ